jgi:hypothetical protein
MTNIKKSINIGCNSGDPNDTRPTCLNLSTDLRSDIKVAAEMSHTSMSNIIEQGMRSYFSQQQSKKDKTV